MYLGAHERMFYGYIYLEGELLGHKLYTFCSLLHDVNLLSMVIVPIYTPSSRVSESLVFNILAMLVLALWRVFIGVIFVYISLLTTEAEHVSVLVVYLGSLFMRCLSTIALHFLLCCLFLFSF